MIDVHKIINDSKSVEVTLYEPVIDNDFVKQFRNKYHLTQVALANILGVKKKTVEKWEQGVNRISGSSAILLHLFDSNPELLEQRYHVEIIVPEKTKTEYQQMAEKEIVTDCIVAEEVLDYPTNMSRKNTGFVLSFAAAV